ncbi:MAG: histidine phosphatase family protein, partial [Candidatus Aenigmatarchaeota archaeon]
ELAFGDKYAIFQDERLRECDYGRMTQTKKDWDLSNYIETSYPGGESYQDVEARIKEFLDFIGKEHEGEKIAVLAHQAPQLALEVLTEGKSWKQAIDEDWREIGEWQPGWKYEL